VTKHTRGSSRRRPWSGGLHHCSFVQSGKTNPRFWKKGTGVQIFESFNVFSSADAELVGRESRQRTADLRQSLTSSWLIQWLRCSSIAHTSVSCSVYDDGAPSLANIVRRRTATGSAPHAAGSDRGAPAANDFAVYPSNLGLKSDISEAKNGTAFSRPIIVVKEFIQLFIMSLFAIKQYIFRHRIWLKSTLFHS